MTQVDLCSMCRQPLPIDAPMRLCPACLMEGALFGEPTSPEEDTASDVTGSFGSDSSRRRYELPRTDPEPTDEYRAGNRVAGWAGDRDDTRLRRPSMRPLGALGVPNYEILGVLGRGGMGIVYRALQVGANRLVALKMIRADVQFQSEQLQRFSSEVRSVASLRHPNVVQIFEVGDIEGRPYFSLELLEGGTLKARLASASMSPRVAAETLLPIASAVAAAHEAGIVHRDLKPSNILFDLDGTPKVADFGLAKRLEADDGHTETGQVVGTPCYMAPEQARGDNHAVSHQADVCSLGAILYEMLTGRPPFKGATTSETIQMVINQEPIRPTQFHPRLPRDLETICLKCLDKEPSRRYPNAGELADDLRRYLAGESIRARPTPAWERAAKWSRRRPTQAAGISAGLVATIALVLLAAWSLERSRMWAEQIAKKKQDANLTLEEGLTKRARGDLPEARIIFKTLLAKLENETGLSDPAGRARAALGEVEARLEEYAARTGDCRRLDDFRRRSDEALLRDGHAAMSPRGPSRDVLAGEEAEGTVLELAAKDGSGATALRLRGDPARPLLPRLEGHPGLVRRDAIGALRVFGTSAGGRTIVMDPLPESFNAEERAEVESGRYLMLMVLSDAVSRPLPGENARRQTEEALGLLDQAAKRRTPSPALHLRRASCFDRLGDQDAARIEREKAARAGPADAFDHLLLGQECSRLGDWRGAMGHFESALRIRDDLFWAHCLLAIAQMNGPPSLAEAARVRLSVCISRQPTYGWLSMLRGYANGRAGWVLSAANRVRTGTGSSSDEAEGRFEEAEADFREALRLGLDDELTYALLMNRGVIRFHRGRLHDAEDDFKRAIALDEGRFNAHAAMAQVLRRQGRPSDAIARLDKAISLEPNMPALYRGRALARLDRGDDRPIERERAVIDLEESAHREPRRSLAAAGDHVGRSHLLLGLKRAADAVVAADAALAIAPNLAYAHLMRVASLVELKQFDRAAESCDFAMAGGHETPDLYRIRGLIRLGKKDYPGAIDDFSRALTLHPDDPARLRCHRGWAYLLAQAPAPALVDFEAVIGHDRSDPEGFAGRAAARVRLGRYREAVADARESLRLAGPSDQHEYNAAQVFAQAAALAASDNLRPRGIATRDSIDLEKRAADLLAKMLERKPADSRLKFWNDPIVRDPMLKPVLHNPLVKQRLQAIALSPR